MRWILDIERRASSEAPVYRQRFAYESDDAASTVACALRDLNASVDLRDLEGEPAAPIRWDSSCLQKKCGACAMRINGIPRLACDTRLAELHGEAISLEPLRKFPVICDLMVDRRALFARLEELGAWLTKDASLAERRRGVAYESSRCLQCGCCLEVCPNFAVGMSFTGMAGMTPLARLLAAADAEERPRLASSYREGVFAGCGKSLACRNVCPAGIDIDRLMSRSNAAAVWRRF